MQKKSQIKSQRQLQVGEQVKRIIADIFLREDLIALKGAQVTISRADVSPDMKNAKIIINIFGNIDKKKMTKDLNGVAPYVRSLLAKQITMRSTPELLFVLDDAGEGVKKTLEILEEEAKKFKD
jgi:ribosome-binding factor A